MAFISFRYDFMAGGRGRTCRPPAARLALFTLVVRRGDGTRIVVHAGGPGLLLLRVGADSARPEPAAPVAVDEIDGDAERHPEEEPLPRRTRQAQHQHEG